MSPSHPIAVPINENNNVNAALNDAPPKYSPPPSYGRAMGLRVAKVLRNSIRRSVRRFRRSEPQVDAATNIPSISSTVETRPDGQTQTRSSLGQSFNEFLRSSIRRVARNSQSNEHLVLTDITTDYHVV